MNYAILEVPRQSCLVYNDLVVFEAVIKESRNLDSTKEKRKHDVKAHSLSFLMLDEILCWTAQEG